MADVIFVAVIFAFFALCVLYVGWCDRIIGPDNFKPERTDASAADAASLDITSSTDKTPNDQKPNDQKPDDQMVVTA